MKKMFTEYWLEISLLIVAVIAVGMTLLRGFTP